MKRETVIAVAGWTLVGLLVCHLAQAEAATSPQAALQEKMHAMQKGMEARGKEGHPPIRAALAMQGLEPLLKEGKLKEAEEVVDRALKALERPYGEDPLEKKLEQVQKAMEKRAKSDVPPVRVALVMKRFESSLKAGKAEQAEEALDLALKAAQAAPGEDPLEKKLAQVQSAMKDLQEKGGEPMLVGMTMSRFGPALEQGDEKAAAAVLDAALKLAKSKDPRREPEAQPYVAVLDKMKAVQEKLPRWLAAGGEQSKIAPLGDSAGQLMKEGKFLEAGKAFDEILAILGKPLQ